MTVKQFLSVHGQSAESLNAEKTLAAFSAEMQAGLKGGKSSLKMLPAYLYEDDGKVKTGGKFIAVDAGGTNFRSGLAEFADGGRAALSMVETIGMPASDGYLTKDGFYNAIAANISRLLPYGGDIGFCFSYPVNGDESCDGEILSLAKGVNAPEAVGTRVGESTLEALGKIDGKKRGIVILNDTVAALLGGIAVAEKEYSSYVGYIYGTGLNLCYLEKERNVFKINKGGERRMVVNTECGNFDKFPLGGFERAAVSRTEEPERQVLEKCTSGKYLAEIMAESLAAAQKDGLFSGKVSAEKAALWEYSAFMSGETSGVCNRFSDKNDTIVAAEILKGVVERAAKLGAVAVAAAIKASCPQNGTAAVAAEGTTFKKLCGYRAAFERYLEEFLKPDRIGFDIIESGGNLLGALCAAAGKFRK